MLRMRSFPLVLAAVLSLVAAPVSATWSIVVVNTETGEVGIASATCLAGFDLKEGAGVIVVGKGAGQAQALLDSGQNRLKIWNQLHAGIKASGIINSLSMTDGAFQAHQYGIASMHPDTGTSTGDLNQEWAGGLTGNHGPLHYAIQGNILTCEAVVTAAEQALRETRGDTATRLMAAMWAARIFGGDSRCSCQPPSECGCPPEEFGKTARVGYIVVARMGDTDGICTGGSGCANGNYYLDIDKILEGGQPVKKLQEKLRAFRQEWRGHADHLHSTKVIRGGPMPADGRSVSTLELSLVDIHRNPVPFGGATIDVQHAESSAGVASIGEAVDHGDGTYSIPLTAGTGVGVDAFEIRVDDGMGPVLLWPLPQLESVEPALTAAGGVGGSLAAPHELLLDGGADHAGRAYALVGGFELGGELVPLGFGFLDGGGAARHSLDFPTLHGTDPLRVAWVTLGPTDFVSNSITLRE